MKKILSLVILILLTINITTIAQNNGCATNAYYSFGPVVNGANLSDGVTFDCTQPLQVEWCYTVEDYSNTPNNNWIHGIYPNPDSDWVLNPVSFNTTSGTLTDWIFESGQPSFTTQVDGFFFDQDQTGTSIDNFGDPGSTTPGAFWEACFAFDYIGGCPSVFPVVDVFELTMNVSDDGFSGSFNDPVSCPPCPVQDIDPMTNLCVGNGGGGFSIQFAGPGQVIAQANSTGCSCENPNNIDLDADGNSDLFYEEIILTTNPATVGITDLAFGSNTAGNFLDASGTPINAPANVVDNGDGTYTFSIYLLPNQAYNADFTSINTGFTSNLATGGNCPPCSTIDLFPIPCQCDEQFFGFGFNTQVNIDFDGDEFADLIYQQMEVTTTPPTAGITNWVLGPTSLGIFDELYNPTLNGQPIIVTDNGDGTYLFEYYTESEQPYTIDLQQGSTISTSFSDISCGPCPIIDPCTCDNPLNVDLDGDGEYDLFHEEITYLTNPPITGINDWVFGTDTIGPFFDATGMAITAPVSATDNGDGTYSFVVFLGVGQPYAANFTSTNANIITGTVSGGNCEPCPMIPTLSEWGLILLALLLLSYGSIVLASNQVLASNTRIPMPNKQYFTLPFHKAIFRKALSITALLVFIGFSICFYIYKAIFFTDAIGVLFTAPIFAYLTHLLYLIESQQQK